jgi:hypothetical protein
MNRNNALIDYPTSQAITVCSPSGKDGNNFTGPKIFFPIESDHIGFNYSFKMEFYPNSFYDFKNKNIKVLLRDFVK